MLTRNSLKLQQNHNVTLRHIIAMRRTYFNVLFGEIHSPNSREGQNREREVGPSEILHNIRAKEQEIWENGRETEEKEHDAHHLLTQNHKIIL